MVLNTHVLAVAIGWVIRIGFGVRQRLRSGGIVCPPTFASAVLFA